ncbi:MAG: HAD-IG family 5'-nucleotidase [Deltaproteobacteria bacterium]|nr:HAD-IG family 5'-nucleotidase [Deltaproteobacteria bacterium]
MNEPLAESFPLDGRGVFCNRTLNLRAIKAIGYDMDYTLVHYHVEAWEKRAYGHLKEKLLARGWPVDGLEFDATATVRGLVIDVELGNVVKTNRFGYVKQALHGLKPMPFEEQRALYAHTVVDLADERWVFVNTLFSHSEVCMYGQLVALLDAGELPGVLGYVDLYREVKRGLDEAHMEGELKAEIVADPERFVDLDSEMPLALYDQHLSGKKLVLITNSEWEYTRFMMSYAFDRFLPEGVKWRDLFDVVIVSARKPDFFFGRNSIFEVVDLDRGLLKPVVGELEDGKVYLGGSASQVEGRIGLEADQILYVGDHLFADVHVSKRALRWRTALIVRELEGELEALKAFDASTAELSRLMAQKEGLEREQCQLRLGLQRQQHGYGPKGKRSGQARAQLAQIKERLRVLDGELGPLARANAELSNARWGLLMRAGNDKSLFARQLERSADVYMSRVSNFLHITPFAYLRSPRGSLPHDPVG